MLRLACVSFGAFGSRRRCTRGSIAGAAVGTERTARTVFPPFVGRSTGVQALRGEDSLPCASRRARSALAIARASLAALASKCAGMSWCCGTRARGPLAPALARCFDRMRPRRPVVTGRNCAGSADNSVTPCRSGFAPAVSSASATAAWPCITASISAVMPFLTGQVVTAARVRPAVGRSAQPIAVRRLRASVSSVCPTLCRATVGVLCGALTSHHARSCATPAPWAACAHCRYPGVLAAPRTISSRIQIQNSLGCWHLQQVQVAGVITSSA